jgi:hypothetical protein
MGCSLILVGLSVLFVWYKTKRYQEYADSIADETLGKKTVPENRELVDPKDKEPPNE